MLNQSPAIAPDEMAYIASHYAICKLIGLPHCKFQGACPLMLSYCPLAHLYPALPAQLYWHDTARNHREKKSYIFLVHDLTNCALYPNYLEW